MASGIGTALAIAALGLGGLGGLRLDADPAAQTVAVVALPWQAGGLGWAAGFGLPIVDLRWNGRVAVLDLSADDAAAQRLRAEHPLLLDAAGAFGCLDDPARHDPAKDLS